MVTKQISKFPIPSDSRKLASVLSPIWALVKKEREVSVTISVNTVLEADSTLLVLGDYKAIQKFFHI